MEYNVASLPWIFPIESIVSAHFKWKEPDRTCVFWGKNAFLFENINLEGSMFTDRFFVCLSVSLNCRLGLMEIR